MRWNKDVTPFGWLLVGVILTVSGIQHMIRQEIYGKVRMPGKPPLMEGWPVFFSGMAEMAVGVILVYWFFRKWKN